MQFLPRAVAPIPMFHQRSLLHTEPRLMYGDADPESNYRVYICASNKQGDEVII